MKKLLLSLIIISSFMTPEISSAQVVADEEYLTERVDPLTWRPDPYLGFFIVHNPFARDNQGVFGGELRFSLPILELNRFVAITASFELGMLSTNTDPRWTALGAPLVGHGAVTVGYRTRTGPLSTGIRTGFSPWFTGRLPESSGVSVAAAPAWLVGTEIGIGSPEFTLTGSFDLHITDFGLMPLVAVGVSL